MQELLKRMRALASQAGSTINRTTQQASNTLNQGVQTASRLNNQFNPVNVGNRLANTQFVPGGMTLKQAVPDAIKHNLFNEVVAPVWGSYAKNQVINPIRQGVTQAVAPNQPLLNRGLGVAQAAGGVFSATPTGMAFNIGAGGGAGALKSARTGTPLAQSVISGMTRPTSLTSEGLGVKNPLLAMAGDIVLTRNPKNIPADLRAISKNPTNIGKAVEALKVLANVKGEAGVGTAGKSVFGRKPQGMHPQDTYEFDRAVDALKFGKKVTPEQTKAAKNIVYNLAERYLPANKRDNANVNNMIKELRKVAGEGAGLIGNRPIPGMGIAGKNQVKAPQLGKEGGVGLPELKKLRSDLQRKGDLVTSKEGMAKLQKQLSEVNSKISQLEDQAPQIQTEPAFGFILKDNTGEYLPIKKVGESSYIAIDKQGKQIVKNIHDPRKLTTVRKLEESAKAIRDGNQDNLTLDEAVKNFTSQPSVVKGTGKSIGLMDSNPSYTPRMKALIKEAQDKGEAFPYTKMTPEEQVILDNAWKQTINNIPVTVPKDYKPYVRTVTGDTVNVKRLSDPAYFKEVYESVFAIPGTDEKLYKILKKELVPSGKEPSSYLADLYNKTKSSPSVVKGGAKVDKLSPQVEAATSKTAQTQVPSPEPPVAGGGLLNDSTNLPSVPSSGGSVPPTTPEIQIDPIQKIITALKEAKPLRGTQEKLYSQERAKRVARVASVGSKVGGEKGFYAQLGQLKGELPKVQFESIRKQFKQSDIDSLFNKVEDTHILSPFEKVTAKGGLSKLLGAEGGSVPTKGELQLLNEIFPPEFIQAVMDKRSTMQKLFSLGENVLNTPRAIMASLDLSAPLRQGIFLVGRPKQFIPAVGSMFKYAFSEKAYQGLRESIQARPTYQLMRQNKLAITDMSPILQGREEAFMSSLAEKIPGFGALAKGSNRAYSGFLNKLRADTFDDLYKNAKQLGLTEDNPKLMEDVAKFVNSATGRGDLGALNRAAVVLNGTFFSPRLMASRINLLNPVYYANLDPFVRKEALKSLITFGGTAMTVLGLAKLGGAEVGADPRSADFGKIKIGNTRYDILGGFQQYLRLSGQLLSGKMISTTTGRETTLGDGFTAPTRKDILIRFFESKENPVVSFVSSMLEGKNAVGDKFDLPVELVNRVTPMMIQDMYDLAKEWGPKGLLMGVPGIFGVGSQTYGKQVPNIETTPTGKASIKLKAEPGLSEDIVNRVRGVSASNIPASQQGAFLTAKQNEIKNTVALEKAKLALNNGQKPSGLQEASYIIDGKEIKGYVTGSNFVYTDKDGNIKTPDIKSVQKGEISYTSSLVSAQMTQAKKADNVKVWSQLAESKIKLLEEQLKDPELSELDKITLQNQIETLSDEYLKYAQYGGFKKPKKVSIPKPKAMPVAKLPVAKVAKSKPIKLSSVNQAFKGLPAIKPYVPQNFTNSGSSSNMNAGNIKIAPFQSRPIQVKLGR